MCSDTRPSVLWDNLTALQPASMKDEQTALFLCKLPRHISNLSNPRAFNTMEEMIQRCNVLWMAQTPEEAGRRRSLLVDSGASISILPHSSSAPSTGPHLVRANGKLGPARGRRSQIDSFAGQDFQFNFFLAAVATPIIGMDFLAKFEL